MRQKKIKILKYLRNSLLYYKANIELNLPTSEFGEEKNCYLEINDTSNIIFKRVK